MIKKTTPADLFTHFGVYALIFNPPKDKILVIKKALGCYTGLYDLPGGGLEPHELLEEALIREVFEETDCTIAGARQLETFSTLYEFQNGGKKSALRHIGTVYTAEVSGTPRETGNGLDDSNGCVWVSLEELTPQNAAPFVLMALKAQAQTLLIEQTVVAGFRPARAFL